MSELPPPEHRPKHTEKESKPNTSKRRHNWGAISAIAGIIGTMGTLAALYPSYIPVFGNAFSHNERVYDGPIAQIAKGRGWNENGFSLDGRTTMANQVIFTFAGHYKGEDGKGEDHNPDNKLCTITLNANPSTSYPYGGQSGFVYLQPGTSYHPDSKVLYNPTPDEVYRTKRNDFQEYVPDECWPGNMTFPGNG